MKLWSTLFGRRKNTYANTTTCKHLYKYIVYTYACRYGRCVDVAVATLPRPIYTPSSGHSAEMPSSFYHCLMAVVVVESEANLPLIHIYARITTQHFIYLIRNGRITFAVYKLESSYASLFLLVCLFVVVVI